MSLLLPDPVATAPGSVFVWGCSSLAAEERKQKLWHRGSTNTERGAVATWSVTITNDFIVTGPGRYRSWFCICLALQLAPC